jgi:hypothetical protein
MLYIFLTSPMRATFPGPSDSPSFDDPWSFWLCSCLLCLRSGYAPQYGWTHYKWVVLPSVLRTYFRLNLVVSMCTANRPSTALVSSWRSEGYFELSSYLRFPLYFRSLKETIVNIFNTSRSVWQTDVQAFVPIRDSDDSWSDGLTGQILQFTHHCLTLHYGCTGMEMWQSGHDVLNSGSYSYHLFSAITELYLYCVWGNAKWRNAVLFWAMSWTIGVIGFDSRRGWEFLSSPPRPQRLWSPLSLLSNGYQGLFPWE